MTAATVAAAAAATTAAAAASAAAAAPASPTPAAPATKDAEDASAYCALEPRERPWQQVTMDFVTGLPAGASGNDAVLVVVNRLTKMAQFTPCRTTIIADEYARHFISTCVCQNSERMND
ncbi:unnamed protein product [Closterium sp. NIES-54]